MPRASDDGAAAVLKKINDFAPGLLEPEIVDIDSLIEDPDNARLHPQRNIEAVMESVRRHGQRSTVIVRRSNHVVAKGNGTLVALKRLGWTRIAASFQEMTEAEFHDYALADNRSGELATWDAEVVARLQRLYESTGGCRVGWSDEDILTLRAAEWQAPDEFPEVDETIKVEHVCPKCGYQFSGGQLVEVSANGGDDAEEA